MRVPPLPSPDSVQPHRCPGLQADTGSRPGPFGCDGHKSGSHGDGSSAHSAESPELRDGGEGCLARFPGGRSVGKDSRALRTALMLAIRHPEVAGGPVVEGNATILKGQLEGHTKLRSDQLGSLRPGKGLATLREILKTMII